MKNCWAFDRYLEEFKAETNQPKESTYSSKPNPKIVKCLREKYDFRLWQAHLICGMLASIDMDAEKGLDFAARFFSR